MRFVTRAPRFPLLLIGGAMTVCVATLSPRLPIFDVAGAAGLPQATPAPASAGRPLEVLFLGHEQPTHGAAGIYQAIGAPLARKGIQLTPVLSPAALTAERLANYDALLIYGNHPSLTPDQEKALVDFVESGKGIVALHSASEMFAGSERYTTLIGARSERQGSGSEFTAEIVQTSHPAVQGVQPFATWDETVTFTRENATDRTVTDGARRRHRTKPVDVGAHAGQGPRLLHSVRPRPADLEQSGVSNARRARPRLECARTRARGLPAVQDPRGHLRRRHERAELREPRSGAQ